MIMKRIIILCGVFLMPFITLSAQEYKYEAKIGWFPFDVFNLVYLMGENPSGETTYGPMKTAGIFSADFDYRVKNWLTIGAKVNYRNSWRDMKTISDGLEVNSIARLQGVSVMPVVKFTTGYDSIFRYYAALGVGAGMDLSSGVNDGFVAFQCTPVGISAGKKISWYFELGIGHAFTGFMTGLSWRF